MNISEAARLSGISAKIIRYYEKVGLIPPATRTKSNYRAYLARDVHKLRFIRQARDLGFSVSAISTLLGLWGDQRRQSADVRALALQHIEVLRTKISGLEQIARTLERLVEACHGDDRPDCPILDELEATVEQ